MYIFYAVHVRYISYYLKFTSTCLYTIKFCCLTVKMATSSWDPDSALLRCPKLHELDLISGNQKTVRVFEGTASKWERIALRLHFDGNTISQLWTESQHNQLRACQNVFNEWLSGKEGLRTPRTWSTVVQVLQEANLGQLADELKYVLGGISTHTRHTAEGSSVSLNPAERMFPFLQSTGMTSEDYEKLQTRLYSESVDIAGAFGVTFNAFFQSLKEQEISVEEVVATLKAFGAFTPVYKGENQPLLREELNNLDLTRASIHSVRIIVLDYCSFYNYRLFGFLVRAHGTPKDKQKLQQYEIKFDEYAKRRVFECPPELGKPTDEFNTNISIKLDDHYEGCTLNQLKLLEADFCKILHITNLKLCHVAPGCLQLAFQLPQFIIEQIFPLSAEQKEELLALHIVSVICGDYYLSAKKKFPVEQMMETTTASTSDMVFLQNKRILILEAKLQEYSRKINDMERQLKWEKADHQRVLEDKHARNLEEQSLLMKYYEAEQIIMQQNYEEEIKNLKESIENADIRTNMCLMEIDHLKEQAKIHTQKGMELKQEKHALEIKIQKLNKSRETLKRELSDVKLEAIRLKHELHLHHREHGREMEILRKQSSKALEEKEAEVKRKNLENEELRWLLSQTYEESTSLDSDIVRSKS